MALVRSFAIVGVNTLGSRILGFVRDILVASALGTGPIADAWVVAFRFPNLFRRLFAEGAFNAAFVPLFARRLEGEGRAVAQRFAEESLAGLLFVLTVVTLVAEIAMPWLMYVIAPGFADDPEHFDMAVLFTRIAFPYLLLMSLVALFGGVLNALGHFALAAAAPMLLNIVLIGAVVFAAPHMATAGHALVWGVTVAGLLQFLALAIGAFRAGMPLRLQRPRLTPGVRRLIALGVPGVIAGGITQLNILIGTMISTFEAGAASILYYADRIYQLPLGVIGIAIGVVLLPELARRLRAGDDKGAHDGQNRAFEFAMLLTLPAAAALIVMPVPIANLLFERGAFDAAATVKTANALIAAGIGLPAFVLVKVFQPAFFAREDTVTPLKFAALSIAVNIAASLVLFFPLGLGYLAIAIATTLAGWVNAISLGFTLYRRRFFAMDARLRTRLPWIGIASVVMAGALLVVQWWLWPGAGAALGARLSVFALMVLGGAGLYFAICFGVGAVSMRDLRRAFVRTAPN